MAARKCSLLAQLDELRRVIARLDIQGQAGLGSELSLVLGNGIDVKVIGLTRYLLP